jgi:hypothetical protein
MPSRLNPGRHSRKRRASAPPIELRVDETKQLFDSLDPFPFHERDIDRKAEEYIVSWARELPAEGRWQIIVHLPSRECAETTGGELGTAFRRFFEYRANSVSSDLRELFRIGRISLLLGAIVLVASVVTAQYVEDLFGSTPLAKTIVESLIILGWVANWRTLEIVLYDWLPLVRRRALYRRLAGATVHVRASDSRASDTPARHERNSHSNVPELASQEEIQRVKLTG